MCRGGLDLAVSIFPIRNGERRTYEEFPSHMIVMTINCLHTLIYYDFDVDRHSTIFFLSLILSQLYSFAIVFHDCDHDWTSATKNGVHNEGFCRGKPWLRNMMPSQLFKKGCLRLAVWYQVSCTVWICMDIYGL